MTGDIIYITIPGEPVAQGRPRFSTRYRWIWEYAIDLDW